MIRLLYSAILLATVATGAVAQQLPSDAVLVDDKVNFPEGPFYYGDKLYYVGMAGPGVLSWDGKKVELVYGEAKCGATAVVADAKHLLVACYSGKYLAVLNHDGSLVKEITHDADGVALVAPNDFTSDGSDGWYFTVTGSDADNYTHVEGSVYHLDKNLEVKKLADQIHYPNGIALAADKKRLFVGEAEAQRIIVYDIEAEHRLTNRRLFARVNKNDPEGGIDAYPDGIKVGPDGNLWVGEYTKPRIAILSGKDGSFIRGIDFPGNSATNMTFKDGGEKMAVTLVDDTTNQPWPGRVYEMTIPK